MAIGDFHTSTWTGTGWVNVGFIDEIYATTPVHTNTHVVNVVPAADDLGEQIRTWIAKVRAEAKSKDSPRPSGKTGITSDAGSHQKGTAVNLYPSYAKTKGGYRAQISLDGDDVIWEGSSVHAAEHDEKGRVSDNGSHAASREAAELIEAKLTTLFADSKAA